jgi:hypothetical protein
VYPLIYCLTFPTPRYRHSIEPELTMLAVFLVSSFFARLRRDQTNVAHRVVREAAGAVAS